MEYQVEQHQKWWLKNKRLLISTIITVTIIIAILIAFALLVQWFGWDWTGFNSGASKITITSTSKGITTATETQPTKSLWDWLQLLGILAIPVVVGLGTVLFTTQQAKESDKNREKRHKTDIQIADENRERQQQTDLQIAADNQREAALQTYLDKMSELLLKQQLGDEHREAIDPSYKNAQKIARTRTLTILHLLDSERKGSILQFLYEAGLIIGDKDKVVVQLHGADLNRAKLTRIFLNGVNLSRVDLNEAMLYRAILTNAILEFADLRRANIREADLIRCDLSNADLTEADLSGAILIGANLHGAIGTTPEQLAKAKTLQGATMPDGSIHE